MPVPSAIEALVFDLIHKPITKEIITRILTHDLLTASYAEQAVDVLYRKEALDCDSYSLYLAFYARHGAVEKVKQGIEKAESYEIALPKDKWHSTLARAYSAKGRINDALHHLRSARDLKVCDAKAHDAVVSSLLIRVKELHDALFVYKQEKAERVKSPNTEFFETETEAKTRETLNVALEAARAVQSSGGTMTERTLINFISALMNAHMYSEALEMVTWANSLGYKADKTAVAEAQFFVTAAQGNMEGAYAALQQLPQVKLNHYISLITYCGDKGDLDTWKQISYQVRQFTKQIRPPIYGKLIDIIGKKGDFAEMEELFREVKTLFGRGVNHIIYSSMITIYINAGDVERAHELFLEMRRFNIEANEVAYTALLRGRLSRNEFHAADVLLAKAQDANITSIGFTTIEKVIPYWADNPGAMPRCLFWLVQGSKNLKSGMARNYLFNLMLDELAKRGNMNACVEFTHEMRGRDIPLSAPSYTSLFNAAAHVKLDGAYEVLRDGVEKDEVDINNKLRVSMLRYAVSMRDSELCTQIVEEIHAGMKEKGALEMDNDTKIDLVELMKQASEIREEHKKKIANSDNKNINDNNLHENNPQVKPKKQNLHTTESQHDYKRPTTKKSTKQPT